MPVSPVSNILAPNYTGQSGSSYPNNIDGAFIAGLRMWGKFAPRNIQPTPSMMMLIDPGSVMNGVAETEVGSYTYGAVSSGSPTITVNGPANGIVVGQKLTAYAYVAGVITYAFSEPPRVTAVAGSSITVSANAAITNTACVLIFGSAIGVQVTGNTHTNTTVDNLQTTIGMFAGMAIVGSGIPAGATIISVNSGTAITISAATSTTLTGIAIAASVLIPTTNPRIDRIVSNRFTGAVSYVVGTPAGTPVPPAVPVDTNPVAQLLVKTSTTTLNPTSEIWDDRIFDRGSAIVVQEVDATYAANASLGTSIPYDDTIPQVTEGTQILSVTITPKSIASKMVISFTGFGGNPDASSNLSAALFSSVVGANAINAQAFTTAGSDRVQAFSISHVDTPGVLTPVTYQIRVGSDGSAMRMNGNSGGRKFGGSASSRLIVREYLA